MKFPPGSAEGGLRSALDQAQGKSGRSLSHAIILTRGGDGESLITESCSIPGKADREDRPRVTGGSLKLPNNDAGQVPLILAAQGSSRWQRLSQTILDPDRSERFFVIAWPEAPPGRQAPRSREFSV